MGEYKWVSIDQLDKYDVLYIDAGIIEAHNGKYYFPTRVNGFQLNVAKKSAAIRRINGKIVAEIFVADLQATQTDYALKNPADWDEIEVIFRQALSFDE